MKKRIAWLSILILLPLIFLTIQPHYSRHRKVQSLTEMFYPNTDTVKRTPSMTAPSQTLKWEFKRVPLREITSQNPQWYQGINESELEKGNYQWQKGDKIYYFNTPMSYWNSMIGREGIAVFRKNKLMGIRVYSMN